MSALRQTARGGDPSTPTAALWPISRGVAPAALLTQTARGGDPRTLRGQETHLPFGLFCFQPPLPCSRTAAMTRWCGMNLLGLDNPGCALHTPCAADLGNAARW